MANIDVPSMAKAVELKVCQLCAVDFTLEHFLLPLIDGMRNEGWSVTAVCSESARTEILRSRGYSIETVTIRRNLNIWSHFLSFLSLCRLFKKHRFDIVHVHTPIAALIGRFAARATGIPIIIYTAHGFYFHDEMPFWKRKLFTYLEVLGGRCTDYLFTQSAEDAETAREEQFCLQHNILAIGNGVNADRFNPDLYSHDRDAFRSRLGISRQSYVVGIVARMVEEKGICEFLQAACQAAQKNEDLVFLMVGARLASDHAGYVSSMIESAGKVLNNRLIMTGARSDIPELLTAMDLFCLPSWREGMPRTILEAMMMAKPVVATNIRGSREEVIDGVTGYLVPTKNSEALETAILKCAQNRDTSSMMGNAGRQRALAHFNEKQVVDLQIDTIKSLLTNVR